jgi:hypothetical protein
MGHYFINKCPCYTWARLQLRRQHLSIGQDARMNARNGALVTPTAKICDSGAWLITTSPKQDSPKSITRHLLFNIKHRDAKRLPHNPALPRGRAETPHEHSAPKEDKKECTLRWRRDTNATANYFSPRAALPVIEARVNALAIRLERFH